MSKSVTPKSKNYSRWYTDVITKAELADYGPVKGTMIIRPYGFQIWENIKNIFDKEFKKMKAPEFHNNVGVNYPELETEKWDMNVEAMQKLADEALETYNEILENLEKMEKNWR